MKKKTIEVFAVPIDELFTYFVLIEGVRQTETFFEIFRGGEISDVELINDSEVRFTVCSPEMQPAELVELRAKAESTTRAFIARYQRGEIKIKEYHPQWLKVKDSFGFIEFVLEMDLLLPLMCEKRGLDVGQKITKVELTNDGVEFTMVRV